MTAAHSPSNKASMCAAGWVACNIEIGPFSWNDPAIYHGPISDFKKAAAQAGLSLENCPLAMLNRVHRQIRLSLSIRQGGGLAPRRMGRCRAYHDPHRRLNCGPEAMPDFAMETKNDQAQGKRYRGKTTDKHPSH